jgi:hypothetical protein
MTGIVPNSADACAVATPPSGVNACSEPIGAGSTGMRRLCPRKRVEVSIFETSRKMRGRNASLSKPWRLRRIVVSVSEPPTR